MRYDRMRRVNEILRREFSEWCEREIVPFVDALVTVTDVKTAPDLSNATVYVSLMGGRTTGEPEVLQLLEHGRADFQSLLARHVRFKRTPVLRFRVDRTAARVARVTDIISELGLDSEAAASPDEEPGETAGDR